MTDWIIGSCVLIVAVFAIRKVFGTRISSRFRYALWAVVMVRLICPAAFWNNQQLTQNITKVSEQLFQSVTQQRNELDKADSNAEFGMENGQDTGNTNRAGIEDTNSADRTQNNDTDNVKNQSINIGQQNGQVISQAENIDKNGFYQTGKEALPQLEEYTQSKNSNSNVFHRIIAQLISMVPAIWLCGSIVVGLWFIGINLRFRHMLMRSRKQIDNSEKPPIYQVKGLSSPCLFGVIHPAIYLKEETNLKDDQLLMILQHERCHYQHKDHIWSVMRSLCMIIWWWNPLVWAAAVASKRDCEMACDEGTLETIGWENKFLYAKTLVDAVSDKKTFGMTAASTMVSGKSDTERRLRMMLNKKKTKMASVVLAAGLILNAAALCFGGESTAQSQSETQINQAGQTDQTTLPVLSAVDVYEQIPITDGVEEFCETFGLLDKEYVAQITPEWMKDSGIALFRDALNERVYITWQDQLIAVPQLAQGKLTTVSDVKVLSVAAADLDEDGVYEVYFTARVYIGGSSTHTNMIGMAKLTDGSFSWDFGVDDQMNNKSNVLMLTQNENGELVWSEAQYKKTSDSNLRESTDKGPGAFSLTQTDEKNEQMITLIEGYLTGQFATGTASEYLLSPVFGQSTDLDNLNWLIPQGRLRWGMTLDELKVWYGDTLEIVSKEDDITTVQISDAYILGCNAAITATVDKKAGVTKLQYEFAKEDKDVVVANANKGLLTNQTVSAAEGINVIYNCVGISPANLELDSQKRFREICEQRGTWSDTEEMRYDAKVRGQLAVTEDACELSFEAEPEMAILYRELLTAASSEMSGIRTQWQQLDKENLTFSWTPSLETTNDSKWVMLEGDNANQLSTMAQALLGVAQPYLFGGFSEKLISSAAYALDALKQSEDDVICRITDSDGNRDAVFLINENGSGYCFVAVSDDIIAQVGLFSFTPCDTGKELYRRMWEEINKYDTIVAQ